MTDKKNEPQRRRLAPDQKIAILKAHLVDKKPISDLCDQHGIQPSQFYRWQQEFFERGGLVFESGGKNPPPTWSARWRPWRKNWPARMRCSPN